MSHRAGPVSLGEASEGWSGGWSQEEGGRRMCGIPCLWGRVWLEAFFGPVPRQARGGDKHSSDSLPSLERPQAPHLV